MISSASFDLAVSSAILICASCLLAAASSAFASATLRFRFVVKLYRRLHCAGKLFEVAAFHGELLSIAVHFFQAMNFSSRLRFFAASFSSTFAATSPFVNPFAASSRNALAAFLWRRAAVPNNGFHGLAASLRLVESLLRGGLFCFKFLFALIPLRPSFRARNLATATLLCGLLFQMPFVRLSAFPLRQRRLRRSSCSQAWIFRSASCSFAAAFAAVSLSFSGRRLFNLPPSLRSPL